MSLSVIFYSSCHSCLFSISFPPFSFSISVCPVLPCHFISFGLRGWGGPRRQELLCGKQALQPAEPGKRGQAMTGRTETLQFECNGGRRPTC